MGGISPLVHSLLVLDRERARLKAAKAAADTAAREPRQANGMRVKLRVLEAKAELERMEAQAKTEGIAS